jgi:hypothetical protein
LSGGQGKNLRRRDDARQARHVYPAADRRRLAPIRVNAAIVVAVMFGTWLTRVTVLAVFAVLVFVSHVLAGLTSLHVAAAGHLIAIVTSAELGLALTRRQRRVRAEPARVTNCDNIEAMPASRLQR